MTKTLIDQRAALEAELERTRDAVDAAKSRSARQRYGSEAAADITAPLRDFHDAIDGVRPDATPEAERPERLLELTKEVADAVVEAGLVFDPIRTDAGFALAVVDPSVLEDFDAALAAKSAAAAALREFDRDHGDDLRAERKAADAQAIRDAYEGDDPDALRAALERKAESEQSAREATADALVSGQYAGWDDRDEIRRGGELANPDPDAMTTADLA